MSGTYTTHLHDISRSVTILRERHPFEGRSLHVMGTLKRRGTFFLLLALPDGSRTLVPANWTDWKATEVVDQASGCGTLQREACLAPLIDLLRARAIVDALLGRCPIRAADEESSHATDPDVSRTPHPRARNSGVFRPSRFYAKPYARSGRSGSANLTPPTRRRCDCHCREWREAGQTVCTRAGAPCAPTRCAHEDS